jgi:hypothetical protein
MGRTVSTPSNAVAVVYVYLEYDEHDTELAYDIENLRYALKAQLKGADDIDKWCGREDRGIVADDFGYCGVSEYCGLLSIWAVPKDEPDELDFAEALERAPKHERWHASIGKVLAKAAADTFGEANCLRKVGTFSNGEGVYERVPA